MRRRVFEIIQIGRVNDLPSRIFDVCLVAVILLNILAMFLETFEELAAWHGVFEAIELITVTLFCVEYALRIWTADYLYPGVSRGKAILRFLRSYDGVIDLLTILPFFFLSGFVVFRMLRVVRIFHLFRINTRYDSFNVIKSVLYEKRNQIASSVFIIVTLMLAASLCMYSVEHEAQPENFRNALSGVWWSINTLLTVGYGDIYPVTILGKAMAIVITFLGVGAVAIPTGIISAGFVEQY
ncbi:MAG: ion transporter, partial [Oscillospiraceae bacterium]|nr:ion transporter [Oscillospiraceae bacterium]